jgi:hypothetical protein
MAKERSTIMKCKECGHEFKSPNSQVHRRVYCSKNCKHTSKEYSELKRAQVLGRKNGMWKTGTYQRTCGYVLVTKKDHPYRNKTQMLLHRLIVEQWLSDNEPSSEYLVQLSGIVYLNPMCVVHHVDGNKSNNVAENLKPMWRSNHQSMHNNLRIANGIHNFC